MNRRDFFKSSGSVAAAVGLVNGENFIAAKTEEVAPELPEVKFNDKGVISNLDELLQYAVTVENYEDYKKYADYLGWILHSPADYRRPFAYVVAHSNIAVQLFSTVYYKLVIELWMGEAAIVYFLRPHKDNSPKVWAYSNATVYIDKMNLGKDLQRIQE